MEQSPAVRIDLHCHSSWSDSPHSWFLRAAHAAECYTAPERVYELARARGMDLVTLTDHDTIGGALELAERHPDVFVSEEISGRFPEDGCVVHIIALDIDEEQHREVQRLRRNVYELVPYLASEQIAHFWCHPLSDVNRRLAQSHLESCFLMFRTLELRNGTRDPAHERELLRLTGRITPALLERWAERNPAAPVLNPGGQYAFVGGSDDHGGVAIARAFTEFRGPARPDMLAAAIAAGEVSPRGDSGSPDVLAHNAYGVVAGHLLSHGQLRPSGEDASPAMMGTLARYRARLGTDAARLDAAALRDHGHESGFQDQLGRAARRALVGGWREPLEKFASALERGRLADAADSVPDLIRASLMELPYLLAARYVGRDRGQAERFSAGLLEHREPGASPTVTVLSDTLCHTNGLAIGLRRLADAARLRGLHLELVGTADGGEASPFQRDGITWIPSILGRRLEMYPEVEWHIPHLPALIGHLVDSRAELVQLSTPGPLGVAGLVAARAAGLRVIGQFHTDVPAYASRLTGDPTFGAMIGMAVGWFFRSVDHVLAPSPAVVDTLARLGVPRERVSLVPRGIDLALFRPERRSAAVAERLAGPGRRALLYLGRLSREKGLAQLADAFEDLCRGRDDVTLVLVGDGPMRDELAARLPAGRAVMTGVLAGDELAAAVASCDALVFPSETETFGNAVVEAQACGLPAIVSERGAARERIVPGKTGLTVDIHDRAALAGAMARLVADGRLRRRMGRAAHAHAQRYSMEAALLGTFDVYERLLGRGGELRRPAPEWAADARGFEFDARG